MAYSASDLTILFRNFLCTIRISNVYPAKSFDNKMVRETLFILERIALGGGGGHPGGTSKQIKSTCDI